MAQTSDHTILVILSSYPWQPFSTAQRCYPTIAFTGQHSLPLSWMLWDHLVGKHKGSPSLPVGPSLWTPSLTWLNTTFNPFCPPCWLLLLKALWQKESGKWTNCPQERWCLILLNTRISKPIHKKQVWGEGRGKEKNGFS